MSLTTTRHSHYSSPHIHKHRDTPAAMPHSFGYRARTRSMFRRAFGEHGVNPLSIYMRNYKVGDVVDIKANSSIQKGMPFKGYHGRTGVVYNVTKRALGVEVNKLVNGKIIKKKINIRVEHLRPSTSRKEWIERVRQNELQKKALKAGEKEFRQLKRLPKAPKEAFVLKYEDKEVQTIQAIPFVDLV